MTASGTVLIVDDESSLRQTLARILRQAGFDVTTAEDGPQALAFMEATDFDLVYLDIRMPGMGGPELLKIIHAKYPDRPVILFTAQPDLNSAVDALRSGAIDYLLKPLSPDILIEKTRAVFASRQKERRKLEIRSEIERLRGELQLLESDTAAPAPVPPLPAADRYLKRGPLVLDLHARSLTVGDRTTELAPAAFDYLTVLARHAPEVVDYRTLVAEAQGLRVETREAQELVKWHIHHIRQAIEPDSPCRLINLRGVGYRLLAD